MIKSCHLVPGFNEVTYQKDKGAGKIPDGLAAYHVIQTLGGVAPSGLPGSAFLAGQTGSDDVIAVSASGRALEVVPLVPPVILIRVALGDRAVPALKSKKTKET